MVSPVQNARRTADSVKQYFPHSIQLYAGTK